MLSVEQPQVDPARIGIYGVSMGGRLTWIVAGLDERVKAAVSVYGAVSMSEPLPGLPGSEQVKFTHADRETWRATIETDAYIPRIRCPFFFLGAADDFYGAQDFVSRALDRVPHSSHWQSYTPHFNHHVEPEQAAALPQWMDRWLRNGSAWPASPVLRIDFGRDGLLLISVSPDQPDEVQRVNIYYSVDPYPQSRFWRSTAPTRNGRAFRALLPPIESSRGVWAWAAVLYRSGLSLSSRLAQLRRLLPRATDPPELLIDGFQRGAEDWFVPLSPPNPLLSEKRYFQVVEGPDGAKALAIHSDQGPHWRMATRKIGDPKWQGPAGASLLLRIRSEKPNSMFLLATENEFRRPKETRIYAAQMRLEPGWHTLEVPLASFHALEGKGALASWDDVNLLTLESQHQLRSPVRSPAADRWLGEPWQGPPPALARIEWKRP